MAPRILVCISGWNDADLLRGCLASVAEQGWPVLYVDGAYRTYCRNRPWWTDEAALFGAFDLIPDGGATIILADRGQGPWESEAAKKTAMMRHAESIALDAHRADWLLVLDTDERVECERGALDAWLAEQAGDAAWAYLNIYRLDRPGLRTGYRVPRLLRAARGLEFRPPHDFHVYREGERIALLEGESSALKWGAVDVPVPVARIRHERHLRPAERLAMSGSYIRAREGRAVEGDTRW